MKDAKGLYYFPYPSNKKVRMYVRRVDDEICFRLYQADEKKMWDEHGWVPHDAIIQAVEIYEKKSANGFDPTEAYNIDIAKELLKEDR